MNKHWVLCLAAVVMLGGCKRSADLTVHAVANVGEEQIGRAQLEIRLVPYDRDSLFNAMASLASSPEPQPPADLLALRDSIAAAQDFWRNAEATWNEARSEMQRLSEAMDGMDRSSNEYFQAYQQFDQLDGQERRLSRDKDVYFEQFTALQARYSERADSFSAVVAAWEEEVFADYGVLVDSLVEATKREDLYDTTDASGWAFFVVPKGRWYIHTRFQLPFEELYWNFPYDASGGAADTIVLDESNAEVRIVF